MKTFLILLDQKQSQLFNDHLLKIHIDFLKRLYAESHLLMCGPFTDNEGAVLIVKADSASEAEEMIKKDPFIIQNYYKKYIIKEFMMAGNHNNWLADAKQTKGNLPS